MTDLDDLLPKDFNAEETAAAAQDGDYDPLPAGWYTVRIERTEVKDTRNKDGMYLNVALVVEAPRLTGRWVFDAFNLKNKSKQAEEIAAEDFSKLCVAVGISGRPNHMSELVSLKLDVKLRITTQQGFEPKNEVVAYRPAGTKVSNGAAPGTGATGAVPEFDDVDVPF